MELLFGLFEAVDCCAVCADLFLLVIDLAAYKKSSTNRGSRRAAKKAGEQLPPRDIWSWAVIILTMSVVALGAMILIGWLVQNM